MFNKSFWAMKQDLAHGHNVGFSLFGGQGTAKGDAQAILDFNTALKNGVDNQKAWAIHMSKASISAQNMTRSTLRAKGSLTDLAKGLKSTEAGAKAASIGMKALSVAGNILLTMGITMAISAIVNGLQSIANAQERAIEKADEFISKFNEQRTSLTENKKAIDSMSEDYEKLANGVDSLGRNVSLNSNEYARYNEIVNQIADMFPQMVQGYTDEGNAIIAHKGNVEELTKAYEDQKKAAQDAIIVGSADVYAGFKAATDNDPSHIFEETGLLQMKELADKIVATGGDVKKIQEVINGLGGKSIVIGDVFDKMGLDKGWFDWNTLNADYISENIKKFQSLSGALNTEIKTQAVKIKPIMQAYLEQSYDYQGLDSDIQDIVKQIVGQFDSEFYAQFDNETEMAAWVTENIVNKFKGKNGEALAVEFNTMFDLQTKFNAGDITVTEYQQKLTAFLSSIGKLPDETQKAIKLLFGITTDDDGATFSDVDTMIANVKEKLKGKFEDKIGQLTLDDLEILADLDIAPEGVESWAEVEALIAEAKKTTDKTTLSLEDFNKEMDKVQEGYDAVQSAIDEYNEKGYLSVDTTQKLLEVDDKLLATLVDENGQVNLNTLGFEDLARAKLENLKASATEALTTWISKLEEEGTTADELAAKYVKVAAAKDLANGKVQTGYTDKDGNWVDITGTPEYKAYLAKIKALESAINGIGKGGLGNSKGSDKNEALDNYLKDAENRYKIHQDETKYIQELEYAYDNLTKTEKERLDITGKINESYRDLADNRIKDIEHQIDLQKELYGDDVDVTGYYDQIQVVAQEEANRLRAMGYDDSSNEVQAMQKAWWDAQNSKLDFYSKQHENIIRDIEYARDMALSANPFTDTTSYYKQLQNEYHNEAERLRALDPEKYKDEIENLSQAWWSAQKSIVDGSYSNSERWISERNAYNDWELYGDNEVDAWGRVLERFKTEFPNELEKIEEIEQKIFEARKNAMEKSISDIDDYIDARNHYNDWDAYGDSEIKAIQRQTKIIEDAYEQRLLSYEEYVKKIEENNQRLYSVAKNSVIETISNLIEDYEEKIQNKTDALGLKSSQYDSLKTLLQSYYDVTNAVAEAQHEINKELKASQSMYEYLNEETRDLLFNQEDYEVLNEKLIDIQSSANALQEQYNKDILNATKETIDEITSQYQMQYETMMKQYEVAKAELDVAKKRQKLDNVLAERNVRMFINGQWQWVANTQNVIDAQNELAEAEIQREQTEASLEQVDSINKLTSAQDDITTQINYLETDLEKVRNKWADMQKMLSGESNAVAKVLKEISTVSSPELKKVIEETGGSISAFSASLSEAIYTLLNGGSSPKAPSSSQNYNATATLPNGTTVGVNINNKGKTTTPDLPKGTVVHTAGGDFEIIGGSGGNYDSKPVSSSSSGGGSSSSSSSGKTVQVGSDGNAPKGTNVGDVVKTAGGDYLVVPPNTEGASYNSASGLWSVKIDEKDADGTRYTSGGVTLMGEDGFEAFISNNGRLIPIDRPTIGNVGAGGIVFNREQMANLRNLWDWSNIGKVSSYASSSNSNSQSTVIDNSIHINGLTISEQGNEDWINGLRRYVTTHK